MKITESAFLSALTYDPDTGWFTWEVSRPGRWKIKKGSRAGGLTKNQSGKYYRTIMFSGQPALEHRLAFLFMEGRMPLLNIRVDHINGDGTDNRWINLRLVTDVVNSQNLRKYKNNTSGVTGVKWNKKKRKWQSQIDINKKRVHLGEFHCLSDAIEARKNAEITFGFHENHGSDRPL